MRSKIEELNKLNYELKRAETCREYRGYIIKYFVNCCKKEGIIIYSLIIPSIWTAVPVSW
jgi:hypothetical protein